MFGSALVPKRLHRRLLSLAVHPQRLIAALLLAAAVAALAVTVWLTWDSDSANKAGTPSSDLNPGSVATTPAQDPTIEVPPTVAPTTPPTAVPLPTATPVLVPITEIAGASAELLAVSPVAGCETFTDNVQSANGTIALECGSPTGEVVAAATGRIVHIVSSEAIALNGDLPTAAWNWPSQASLGPHVVVDHGPLGDVSSLQTVYAGFDPAPELRIGAAVDAGAVLGRSADPIQFAVWTDGTRQDGIGGLSPNAPGFDEQLAIASALGEVISSPVDARCPLSLGAGELPGAARAYRNGIHRGIDFGCGAADRSATAISAGTVAYLVDDYVDPTPEDRELLLGAAGQAQITPHWTLVMLYGNVVILDHGNLPGVGRVTTISAHLESVRPGLELGSNVDQGSVIGEIGNRGTSAAARGIFGDADPSLHLHWELYIDGWFLGQGLQPEEVRQVIDAAMCGAQPVAGCG